jgi:hypothetical protein
MMNEAMLEQTLEDVEHAVAELQAHLADRTKSSDRLEKVKGSVTDEEVFREALLLGRAFRRADRPGDAAADEP